MSRVAGDAERGSGARWLLAYVVSLVATPLMVMPFTPGTRAFGWSLAACLLANAIVGASVARGIHRSTRGRTARTWEMKLLWASRVTAAACVVGLGALLLAAA